VQPIQKRVLVVDDEPTIRDLIADALREADFEVEIASNGVEALSLMHRWVPDVVVLDLMMPRLDASGFTELMRLNPRFAGVPVLLVTAAYGAQQAAEQVGARAWLSKPFELEHLVAEVTRLAGSTSPLEPISDIPVSDARRAASD
jgi:two-component system OmpR family response regulator